MAIFNRQTKGKKAEALACCYLELQGLQVLKQNYFCHHGEIDLIMRDQAHIVFVEVRSRSRIDYGTAAESVNRQKRHKLMRSAKYFLQKERCLYKVHSRFDIVAIHLGQAHLSLDWIKNAFSDDDA